MCRYQGATSVVTKAPELNAFLLFVLPPSRTELERRLRGRGTEKEEAIAKRLAASAWELEQVRCRSTPSRRTAGACRN